MFNNNTTATCPQNVPVKKFWKSVNICQRYGQLQSGTFFETQCSLVLSVLLNWISADDTRCKNKIDCFFDNNNQKVEKKLQGKKYNNKLRNKQAYVSLR